MEGMDEDIDYRWCRLYWFPYSGRAGRIGSRGGGGQAPSAEVDQPELAVGLYEFVIENGSPQAMRAVARERLARLLLDQGRPEDALRTLEGAQDISGFEARYAEVRGDIMYAQGRRDDAVAAYLEALNQREAGVGDRAKLVMKLQSMGAEIPPEDAGS